MCSIQRPLDTKSQPRIAVKAEAILGVLTLCEAGQVELMTSDTLVFELERNPQFARRMLGGLSRRLHGLVSDVEAYSLRSGAQRVIGYLLRDLRVQTSQDNVGEVTLPIGKGVIASRLNLTPQHFSRILHELSVQGLIVVEGRKVHIVDLERLRAFD